MTYKKTTRKPSFTRKRRPHRNPRRNSTLDDNDGDYTSVVRSDDDTLNDSDPNPNHPHENDVNSLTDSLNDTLSLDSRTTNDIVNKPQTSSYVAIAPFPIFRGGAGECPDAHLSRFAKVCRANDVSSVDSMVKIFPVTLLDEALLWYDLNIEPYGEQLSWEDIKSSFSQAYGSTDPPETIRSELGAIRQGQEELVRSYFLRLQCLLQKLPEHGLSDGDLNRIFIRGLRVDIRDRVVAVKPGCLKEALRVAFGFEKERKRTTSAGGNGTGAAPDAVQRSVSSSSKSQCQCSKHQCWRKNLEKNLSDVGGSFKG